MLHRIGHILLTGLILLSSTGVVLNLHYCQDELKSTAFFFAAEPCHSGPTPASCPMHPAADTHDRKESKNCCDDDTQYVKAEADQYLQSLELELDLPPFLVSSPMVSLLPAIPTADAQSIRYLSYKPPPLVCDLPVRLQTFRC